MPLPYRLNIDALLPEEKAYLLGLYLADGSAYISKNKKGRSNYRVKFCLQGDQQQIAKRLVEMLNRLIGVSPRIVWEGGCMWAVKFESKALFEYLPSKRCLLNDQSLREVFFSENRLYRVENGVPFLAGLLDGDGSCEVQVREKECCFGSVKKWKWSFSQSKALFLINYAKTFVATLALDENSVKVTFRRSRGETRLSIRKSGIIALLNAGIAEFSWKVEKWLTRVAEAQRERTRYFTVGQVAKMFGISGHIVRSWLKANNSRYLRRSARREGLALSWYYIPVGEIGKLWEKLHAERDRLERIKKNTVKLVDVANMSEIPLSTLQWWCRIGKLRSMMIREAPSRHLVVPRDEVKKFKARR